MKSNNPGCPATHTFYREMAGKETHLKNTRCHITKDSNFYSHHHKIFKYELTRLTSALRSYTHYDNCKQCSIQSFLNEAN